MTKRIQIFFISNNATRTGAPIVLYHFLKWLKENGKCDFELLFLEGGDMLGDFEKLCDCQILPSLYEPGVRGMIRRFLFRKTGRDRWLENKLKYLRKFDLLFFNTAATFKLLPHMRGLSKPQKIAWLHEQPFSIRQWYAEDFTFENLSAFEHLFCVSSQTENWLINQWKIPAHKLSVIYPFIPLPNETNCELSINNSVEEKFIVGGCGLQDWRKGPDLFLQIALYFKIHHPELPVYFEWVGAPSGLTAGLRYELEKLELKERVLFSGQTTDTSTFYQRIDIFILTSREDPFPLVVLEAAASGKPILCFEGIGDITKIVRTAPENIIPYGRVDLVVERLVNYMKNKQSLKIDGNRVRESACNYSVEVGSRIFWEELSNLLAMK